MQEPLNLLSKLTFQTNPMSGTPLSIINTHMQREQEHGQISSFLEVLITLWRYTQKESGLSKISITANVFNRNRCIYLVFHLKVFMLLAKTTIIHSKLISTNKI